MSSFDTARLLLIISGVEGELWESPSGITVTKDVLSASSREYFMSLLGRQGHNERLSTTSWCGADYPAPGIPSRVADEWVDQETGFVTVGSRQYGRDVRPCNKNAEVTFSHKSGWTEINSSDAGEVQSLEGQDWRRYIIAYTSNLSKRFIDPHKPADVDVLQTEKVGKMGKEVDLMMKRRGKY